MKSVLCLGDVYYPAGAFITQTLNQNRTHHYSNIIYIINLLVYFSSSTFLSYPKLSQFSQTIHLLYFLQLLNKSQILSSRQRHTAFAMTIQNFKGHIIVRRKRRCLAIATRHLIKISFIDAVQKPLDFHNTCLIIIIIFFLPPNHRPMQTGTNCWSQNRCSIVRLLTSVVCGS